MWDDRQCQGGLKGVRFNAAGSAREVCTFQRSRGMEAFLESLQEVSKLARAAYFVDSGGAPLPQKRNRLVRCVGHDGHDL